MVPERSLPVLLVDLVDAIPRPPSPRRRGHPHARKRLGRHGHVRSDGTCYSERPGMLTSEPPA